jgi:ABC-type transport system substrate-binding protein
VFETLYGIDTSWMAQPQMVERQSVDDDGLVWTLKLRDGLRFHDNEPMLARDVVASIGAGAASVQPDFFCWASHSIEPGAYVGSARPDTARRSACSSSCR